MCNEHAKFQILLIHVNMILNNQTLQIIYVSSLLHIQIQFNKNLPVSDMEHAIPFKYE